MVWEAATFCSFVSPTRSGLVGWHLQGDQFFAVGSQVQGDQCRRVRSEIGPERRLFPMYR
jgi:hypothetical protein